MILAAFGSKACGASVVGPKAPVQATSARNQKTYRTCELTFVALGEVLQIDGSATAAAHRTRRSVRSADVYVRLRAHTSHSRVIVVR